MGAKYCQIKVNLVCVVVERSHAFSLRVRENDLLPAALVASFMFAHVYFTSQTDSQTFEHGTYHCLSFDGTEAQVLSKCHFQIEKWNATGY